jgi:hypothetical protein
MMSFRGGRLRAFSMPAGTVWLLTDIAEAKGCQPLYPQRHPGYSRLCVRRTWYRA